MTFSPLVQVRVEERVRPRKTGVRPSRQAQVGDANAAKLPDLTVLLAEPERDRASARSIASPSRRGSVKARREFPRCAHANSPPWAGRVRALEALDGGGGGRFGVGGSEPTRC